MKSLTQSTFFISLKMWRIWYFLCEFEVQTENYKLIKNKSVNKRTWTVVSLGMFQGSQNCLFQAGTFSDYFYIDLISWKINKMSELNCISHTNKIRFFLSCTDHEQISTKCSTIFFFSNVEWIPWAVRWLCVFQPKGISYTILIVMVSIHGFLWFVLRRCGLSLSSNLI